MKKPFSIKSIAFTAILLTMTYVHAVSQQVAKVSVHGRGYLEYLPPGYATSSPKLYPCIIFLHGSGERGNGTTEINKVTVWGTPKFIKNGANMCFTVDGVEECFIVLSPQQTTNRFGWGVDVIPYVKDMLAAYRIDPNRVCVTGLSMGGDGSWDTSYDGANTPNLYAALAPVSCKGDYNGAKGTAAKKIYVWAFHGNADTQVPIANGQRPINGMLSVGANPAPIFTVVAGGNHGGSTWDKVYSPTHTYYNPNVYEWFLTKRRASTTPTPPTANAGVDKTIVFPAAIVSVTGTVSDPDGGPITTAWTQVSGPNNALISAATALTTNFTGLIEGTYSFSLTATDNTGLTASDAVTIQVNPAPPLIPPTANAGADKSITEPANSVVFTGSGSDADNATPLTYLWTQTNGPTTAGLSGQTTTSLTASGLIVGSYTFTLTATDATALTGSDQVVVTVLAATPNAPPSANAGTDQSITRPASSVNLTGNGTDSDGPVPTLFAWTQSGGPNTAVFGSANQKNTTATNLIEGVYTFTLTVTDNKGATGVDQVIVTVMPAPPNFPPTANAGTDITITAPTSIATLTGSGNDPEAKPLIYAWTQTSGPNIAVIATSAAASTNLTGLIEGNYLFTLTVRDDISQTGSDQVLVKVLPVPPNLPPTANAGADKNITLPPNSTSLTGTGIDPEGGPVTYLWAQSSGPNIASIGSAAATTTTIGNLIEGVYTFSFTVTDNKPSSGSDFVVVTVFPPANVPPTADAGTNATITLPTSSVALTGSGSDPDGGTITYLWEQVSGPALAGFSNATSSSTNANSLTDGIYVFSITVTDNNGAKTTDQVQITVLPQPPNQLPIANAGGDQTLILPANSTTLNGSGTDPDAGGSIVSYAWNFVSGPATGATGPTNQASLDLSNLVKGIYVFQLKVTDNSGGTAYDEVKIFVNAVNRPPVAQAGGNRTITLPTSTTSLVGSASDPDGDPINSHVWEQISGPNIALMDNALNYTVNLSGLIQGNYMFSLRATDIAGDTDADQVTVTVNPAPPNSPPTASVGPNQEITLPVNSVLLGGSGSDPEGSVLTYLWSQVSGPATATPSPNPPTALSVTYGDLETGTYVFRFTVTDDQGAKGQKDVSIKVNPQPANLPPLVDAGVNQEITLPISTISLNGSGSDPDGPAPTLLWLWISGPSIPSFTSATSAATDVTDLVEGVYVFRLSATDDESVSSFDEVIVTVNPIPYNLPPISEAGGNKVLTLPASSTLLDGSGNDTDGSITGFLWSQISGPNIATVPGNDFTTEDLAVSGLIEGVYVFRLTVTDNQGSTGFDEINIRVQPVPANQPPTADTGNNQIITLPTSSTSFDGVVSSDPEGPISTYTWTWISGPSTIPGGTGQIYNVSGLIEGTYVFRLTVRDAAGTEGFDEVNVRVNREPPNSPPTASAGNDITITLPTNSTTVTGTASDAENPGTITHAWTQVSGPSSAVPTPVTTLTLPLTNLIEGSYKFRLTVTDEELASIFDEVIVVVNPEPPNDPPVVNAGTDLIIIMPATVSLDGTASDDLGIASTAWSQVLGPTTATFSPNAAALDPSLGNLSEGSYTFRLTATDNSGNTTFDEVVVSIADNKPPIAFAGDDPLSIYTPENSVSLVGSGADPEGEAIQSYSWTFVSGTTTPIIPPNQQNVTVNGLAVGDYVFRLTVTDIFNATGIDDVTLHVLSSNLPPVADAGADISINLPTTHVDLLGSGTDTEDLATNLTYAWTQTGGTTVTITDSAFSIASADGLSEGDYEFTLTVTDQGGLSDTDAVAVHVGPAAANIPPVANAGENITITLPDSIATLHGSGTDTDGTIASYAWSQASGPPAVFLDASVAEPVVTELIVEGSYVFVLTVTDDLDSTSSDEVTVTVLPAEITEAVHPKVFSPNGDENNDTWTWANLHEYEGCLLTIYTRFGKKVFEMTSYDNSWDGTDNGKPLEAEAYYYIIKCSGSKEITGGVRIVR